ncbi:flavodoxin domain-containing protein [Alkaliphilus hydrothermalis]|uniref:Menaquinone-dependent protoporphyrinogen oxidase n=1 Tax=Alkaliphilus hydrothermalis TaxID=1482730 RepID=A0ABS2NMQ5_9FIRM|nr:flavodoxin domain-containing protein [Alkaliphilus hydrothermalis]MBM7614201.1 menaquinone-dependent protoporphyrinogen oxidase [Alkaliphilus hydrothermalis]
MKTLLVYGTKYGCTEKCAQMLKEKLSGDIDLINLKTSSTVDLSKYNKVIIGGSIYIGQIQKEVKAFCSQNMDLLKEKNLGLFTCCMGEGQRAEEQLNAVFPKELLDLAVAKEFFGGEFIFKKMGFIDKLIVKKVSKITKDTTNIYEENISRFAEVMNNVKVEHN